MSLLDTASLVVTPNGTKASKLYSVVPSDGSGDLSVTRATTATRVNSSGLIESVASNVPRLDYTNGTCPSILVEPQRTNVLTYSEALTPNYSFNQCSITSNQISPDGTNNAKRITNGATATDVYFEQSVGVALSDYTWSAFVKKGTDTLATIKPVHVGIGGDVSLMTFTFATETISTSGAITTSGFTKLANGWYRIYCTVPITLAVISLRGRFGNSNTPNVYNEWFGVQLEAGSYATSYIPTTSASVTRNEDVIRKTGISSLIGQTEGTVFVDVDFTHNNKGTNEYLAQVWQDGANRILLYRSTNGKIAAYLLKSGSEIYNFESSIVANGKHKIAFAYKSGDISFYIDGSGVSSSTSTFTAFSSMSNYDFGIHTANGSPEEIGDYPYSSAALWKTRLTNTQLAQLTTI
jgi:hypothetical protein